MTASRGSCISPLTNTRRRVSPSRGLTSARPLGVVRQRERDVRSHCPRGRGEDVGFDRRTPCPGRAAHDRRCFGGGARWALRVARDTGRDASRRPADWRRDLAPRARRRARRAAHECGARRVPGQRPRGSRVLPARGGARLQADHRDRPRPRRRGAMRETWGQGARASRDRGSARGAGAPARRARNHERGRLRSRGDPRVQRPGELPRHRHSARQAEGGRLARGRHLPRVRARATDGEHGRGGWRPRPHRRRSQAVAARRGEPPRRASDISAPSRAERRRLLAHRPRQSHRERGGDLDEAHAGRLADPSVPWCE